MKITVSNVLTVSEPTVDMLAWCKKNLEVLNPDYAKKARMNLWLGNTPKVLCLYETRGNELILPFGILRMLPKSITDTAVFTADFAPAAYIDYNADIPLYDYQQEAVQAMADAQYGILQSAAGSGKTQMGIALAAKLERRTLWLCHTLDLVRQSMERAERYISKDLIGTITEGKVNIGEGITFATIQTMSKLDLTQYKNYWDVIITDEVHRVSGTPTAVTRYQHVLNSLSARHKYGLSATVHRSDGMIRATYALVGEVAYNVPDKAVQDKIMTVGIYAINTGTQIDKSALNSDGTLNYAKLINYLVSNKERNICIASQIITECSHSCLILSDRLAHLEELMRLLPQKLRNESVMVSGKMTSKIGRAERERAIHDMREGKKRFLFATYSLAKEGLDIPRLDRLFLTTPQKDYAVVTQSIGRIARTFDGKSEPIAFDFVDDIGYLVRSYKKRCTTYRKNKCYFVEERKDGSNEADNL